MTPHRNAEQLLRTSEVTQMLGVSERAVRTWADAGKIACYRTLGGHRQFPISEVKRVLVQIRGEKNADEIETRLEHIRHSQKES